MSDNTISMQGRPVIAGEVLFDTFPDGAAVLGGAPFNVAWHLRGFGMQPLFISRIGDDRRGQAVLQAMRDWGMDTNGVQTDPQRPTGKVVVHIRNGEPAFDIIADQAYDLIEAQAALKCIGDTECALLYHGSLIARSPISRASIELLQTKTGLPVFVDVNLRSPWYTMDFVGNALNKARWVKLNQHELAAVSGENELHGDRLLSAAATVRERYRLDALIITLGGNGALIVSGKGVERAQPVKVSSLVDTVGAGDAFSAVTILGLIQRWPWVQIISRAVEFAAAICTIRGATTRDQVLYETYRQKWGT